MLCRRVTSGILKLFAVPLGRRLRASIYPTYSWEGRFDPLPNTPDFHAFTCAYISLYGYLRWYMSVVFLTFPCLDFLINFLNTAVNSYVISKYSWTKLGFQVPTKNGSWAMLPCTHHHSFFVNFSDYALSLVFCSYSWEKLVNYPYFLVKFFFFNFIVNDGPFCHFTWIRKRKVVQLSIGR